MVRNEEVEQIRRDCELMYVRALIGCAGKPVDIFKELAGVLFMLGQIGETNAQTGQIQ